MQVKSGARSNPLSLPLPLFLPSQVGRFLGEVDGALVTQLLSMGVFNQ